MEGPDSSYSSLVIHIGCCGREAKIEPPSQLEYLPAELILIFVAGESVSNSFCTRFANPGNSEEPPVKMIFPNNSSRMLGSHCITDLYTISTTFSDWMPSSDGWKRASAHLIL